MNVQDYLSDDGQAVLALCSTVALPPGGPDPLKLSEWNRLALQIRESPLQCPAALQGRTAAELAQALALPPAEADRIAALLGRAGRLALELEGLFSRGLWAVTRVDALYPDRLRARLKHQAPSVLFGAGDISLLRRGGVAIVGSRNIDEAGATFARDLGAKTAAAKLPVVSGGARGADRLAMDGGLQAGGPVVGVLADSLERTVSPPDLRRWLIDGQLALMTPYAPGAGFSIGAAMGRNKLIYGLADFAVVASSEFQTGGTWAGAVEALKAGWCPVFVRMGQDAPAGNRELVKQGAAPLPSEALSAIQDLPEWLRQHANRKAVERDLFGGLG